ncbi:WD40-repeat-containing domain protein [Pisolithus thermaeus]|nr:WD40-repeat-containing domain protein [Pisolithus croceorrhizus]KAI6161325.1 WD40-repeat-containing domain protein [Pisolithus thermaeus]
MIIFEISIVKAELPAHANDWTKCFVQIIVDGSHVAKTKSTKKPGVFEWQQHFELVSKTDESVCRFKLRRRSALSLLGSQLLAFTEALVSDLLLKMQKASHEYLVITTPKGGAASMKSKLAGSDDNWHLFIRLAAQDSLPVAKVEHPRISRSLSEIVLKLEAFMQLGDAIAQVHPYAFIAWRTATAVYTILKAQVDQETRLDALGSLMRDAYLFVEDVNSFPEKIPALEETMTKLFVQTSEYAIFIQECSGHSFAKRLVSTAWVERRINDLTDGFTLLKRALESRVAVQTAVVSFRIDNAVKHIVNIQNLMKLHPADMDDPSRPECLPNTRMDIIGDIYKWATTPIGPTVFWLHGFPGAGKSTIATSVANLFRQQRRLGAFTFFTRGVEARSDPASLIRTIAYQLGEFDPRICDAISRVIEETPSIKQAPLHRQFQRLLVEPLQSLEDLQWEGPVLVVIDALDECGRTGARSDLLTALARESMLLPPTLRIFVTSRAEKDIYNAFSPYLHIYSRELDLSSETNEHDVKAYIRHRMVTIRLQNEYLDLPSDWPGASRVDALTLRASGLFVWAATACRYVENGQDPEERLAQLLRSEVQADSESALDNIYITALESAGKWSDSAFAADFREILGIVIVAENRLTSGTIDILNADFTTGRKKRPCMHTIQHLGCVLQWAADKPIRVFHPSFVDFITERRRCGSDAWHINKSHHHLRLARQCIGRLGVALQKNICQLTLSRSFEVQNLPDVTAYPCIHWIDHLCQIQSSEPSLSQEIDGFLHKHFLHWVEAMSAIGWPRQTITLVDKLRDWVDVSVVLRTLRLPMFSCFFQANCSHDDSLRSFVRDAERFCQAYVHVFEQHPLLVYQSALPFTPTSSVIYKTFNEPTLPQVDGFRDQWSPLLTEFSKPGENVTSVSCSVDGRYIASSSKRSISVWDSTSYELVTSLLPGAGNATNIIKFSPNSVHIASGHADGSVRVWDALSGKEILATMKGHREDVYVLDFSEDGTQLVSAGKDQKIVMWDIRTGKMHREPLTGHEKTVLCLCFAQNSTRLASGSRDRSIRIWDTETSKAVLPPLLHHSGGVNALVYTPDGRRLISASDDKTICVWDADSGTLQQLPSKIDVPFILQGHNSTIYSLSISPNGTFLASASKDTTVRLWDIREGKELPALVRQHRLPVRYITFTADGRSIVTSSLNDPVLRVWDTESTGSMGITRRHKGLVGSLSFSSDGKRLASGGKDRRVRVWNVETGEMAVELSLEREVYRVGFSLDGSKILALDDTNAVFAWRADTHEPLMGSPNDAPRAEVYRGPLSLVKSQWIDNTETKEALLMFPNMSRIMAKASWRDRFAVGTANGGVVIVSFPGLEGEL